MKHEFTRDEFRALARDLRPDMTDAQFELAWRGYFASKREQDENQRLVDRDEKDRAMPTPLDERTGGDEKGYYIRTFTGKQFFWNDIESNEYDIHDIAHALSNNCRWTGHTTKFYSVAQHCCIGSLRAPKGRRMSVLLHDAAEAYIHDTPSPLKWHLRDKGFTAFSDIEKRVEKAIFNTFGLPYPMDPIVKDIDKRMLATEHRDLMPEHKERKFMNEPFAHTIVPWLPEYAEQRFLVLYSAYQRGGEK